MVIALCVIIDSKMPPPPRTHHVAKHKVSSSQYKNCPAVIEQFVVCVCQTTEGSDTNA